MTLQLQKCKQPKPKRISALDGNVHFHVFCIVFSIFCSSPFTGGAVFATSLFFYDIAVCEYVVVAEWSASLWSRYRLRETQQQENGLYSGLVSPLNSPGALCIPDGAEKRRRKSRMWKLG